MKINQLLQTLKSNSKYEQKTETKNESTTVSENLLASFKSKTAGVNQLASKYQINLSEKEVKSIDNFIQRTEGPLSAKLDTVEIALFKGIELKEANLDLIHAAITKDPDMSVEILTPEISEGNGDDVERVIDHLKLPENIKKALKSALKEGVSLEDAVKAIAKQIVDSLPAQYKSSLESVLKSGNLKDLSEAMTSIAKNAVLTPQQIAAILTIGIELSSLQEGKGSPLKLQSDAVRIQELVDSITASDEKEALLKPESMPLLSMLKDILSGEMGGGKGDGPIDTKGLVALIDKNPDTKAIFEMIVKNALNQQSKTVLPEALLSEANESVKGSENGKVEVHSNDDISNIANEELIKGESTSELEALVLDEETLLIALDHMLSSIGEANERILQSFDVKTYIIETITEKSAELQANFEKSKLELLNMTNTDQRPTEETIQKAINLLEKMIMKSEVSLYTDMQTEKKLLVLSSQLSEAQKMLSNGETEKAFHILKETHAQIEKIQVNMNPKKIQSFATERVKEALELLKPQEERAQSKATTLKDEVSKLLDFQKDTSDGRSARDILEVLRSLGLNHEVETAESLASKTSEGKMDNINANIKEILLKLMKEEGAQRNVEETLMNLTGQQMMNDSGQRGQQRFQFFNLPFEDDLEINNMKVYMTGKNDNQALDYKNSELYFGMTLKYLGETGIKIQIKDEKVSITVMNDYKDEVTEAFRSLEAEINALGYMFDQSYFEPYKKEKPFAITSEILPAEPYQYDEKKGFDFKI